MSQLIDRGAKTKKFFCYWARFDKIEIVVFLACTNLGTLQVKKELWRCRPGSMDGLDLDGVVEEVMETVAILMQKCSIFDFFMVVRSLKMVGV